MKQMDTVTTGYVDCAKNSFNESVHVVHDNISPRFNINISIPQRRVVLEVGLSRPCGQAFNVVIIYPFQFISLN